MKFLVMMRTRYIVVTVALGLSAVLLLVGACSSEDDCAAAANCIEPSTIDGGLDSANADRALTNETATGGPDASSEDATVDANADADDGAPYFCPLQIPLNGRVHCSYADGGPTLECLPGQWCCGGNTPTGRACLDNSNVQCSNVTEPWTCERRSQCDAGLVCCSYLFDAGAGVTSCGEGTARSSICNTPANCFASGYRELCSPNEPCNDNTKTCVPVSVLLTGSSEPITVGACLTVPDAG